MVLFFNICINYILFVLRKIDICNFADDTTFYDCDSNLKTVLEKLERNSELAIVRFEANDMKLNTDKCPILISDHEGQNF